jgi:hypothetical protein
VFTLNIGGVSYALLAGLRLQPLGFVPRALGCKRLASPFTNALLDFIGFFAAVALAHSRQFLPRGENAPVNVAQLCRAATE